MCIAITRLGGGCSPTAGGPLPSHSNEVHKHLGRVCLRQRLASLPAELKPQRARGGDAVLQLHISSRWGPQGAPAESVILSESDSGENHFELGGASPSHCKPKTVGARTKDLQGWNRAETAAVCWHSSADAAADARTLHVAAVGPRRLAHLLLLLTRYLHIPRHARLAGQPLRGCLGAGTLSGNLGRQASFSAGAWCPQEGTSAGAAAGGGAAGSGRRPDGTAEQ